MNTRPTSPPVSPSEAAPGTSPGWRTYIGRQEVRREAIEAEPLRRFAVATGAHPEVEQHFPPLGHWAFFLDAPPRDRIGVDGHPMRGDGLLPPISLPRRMFAAADIVFLRPLQLGVAAQLRSEVVDVSARSGSSGDLVFVTLERTLLQARRIRVRERRTLVYRGPGETLASRAAETPDIPQGETWRPSSVDLFRFSAATFNAHRIHYDRDYARTEEGYPDLVVHGPFTAAKLCALAQRRQAEARMRRFTFRATAPLFVGDAVQLVADAGSGELRALRPDGRIAMSASAEF